MCVCVVWNEMCVSGQTFSTGDEPFWRDHALQPDKEQAWRNHWLVRNFKKMSTLPGTTPKSEAGVWVEAIVKEVCQSNRVTSPEGQWLPILLFLCCAIDYILQSLPLEMHQVLPCTRAAATSSTTWSPPELLSAAATSVARPPFWSHTWNSQTSGESLMVIVFLMYEVGVWQPYLWGVVMHTKLSPALCWLGPWSAV